MAQMVLRVVTIGAPDDLFGCPQDASNVVDGYAQLEKHCRAGMPEDVRRNLSVQSG